MRYKCFFLFVFLIFGQSYLQAQTDYFGQWPSFRGPFAKGFMEKSKTAVEWDVKTGENIKWQIAIPGLGHSCPVVWDEKLFVTTAISGSGTDELKVGLYGDIDAVEDESVHEFKVYCLNKNTGEIIWEKLSHKGIPRTQRHTKASQANCTPATDGKHLVAFFGSEGLFCYDMDGHLLWKNDLGEMNAGPFTDPDFEWGFASSPIIHKGKVIVQCDYLGDCFIASYDVETGREVWTTPRVENSTWSSPTVYEKDGQTQILVNGWKHMGGYDFETGKEIWKMSGGGDAPTPTPVVADGLIYINNAHGRWSPIYVVKPSAKGDITLHPDSTTNKFIVWSIKRGGAYMQTPLVYNGLLYNLRGNGSLTVFDAISGQEKYKQSLGPVGGFTASGIAAGGLVYFCSEKGDVFVIKAGDKYELLAHNKMNDIIMATPAISENTLFFRTQHKVVAVEEKVKK